MEPSFVLLPRSKVVSVDLVADAHVSANAHLVIRYTGPYLDHDIPYSTKSQAQAALGIFRAAQSVYQAQSNALSFFSDDAVIVRWRSRYEPTTWSEFTRSARFFKMEGESWDEYVRRISDKFRTFHSFKVRDIPDVDTLQFPAQFDLAKKDPLLCDNVRGLIDFVRCGVMEKDTVWVGMSNGRVAAVGSKRKKVMADLQHLIPLEQNRFVGCVQSVNAWDAVLNAVEEQLPL